MKVLVTGSSGFLAGYLIPALSSDGASIVGIDIAPPPPAIESLGTFYRGDIASPHDVYRVMATEHATHVVHLASILAGPCEENPTRGFAINFGSTLTLLDAGSATGVERFIFASSIAVFGRGLVEPVSNDAPKEPATIYGQTKLACEQVLEWYRNKRNLSGIALRFPWVFGPGRERGITALYSSKLLDAIAKGERLVIDNPEETGDWLYVKDAVRALQLGIRGSDNHRTAYNIMGGVHAIRDVLDIAEKVAGTSLVEYRKGGGAKSPYPSEYDDSCARDEMGWAPAYSIEEAVRDHIATVRRQHGQ